MFEKKQIRKICSDIGKLTAQNMLKSSFISVKDHTSYNNVSSTIDNYFKGKNKIILNKNDFLKNGNIDEKSETYDKLLKKSIRSFSKFEVSMNTMLLEAFDGDTEECGEYMKKGFKKTAPDVIKNNIYPFINESAKRKYNDINLAKFNVKDFCFNTGSTVSSNNVSSVNMYSEFSKLMREEFGDDEDIGITIEALIEGVDSEFDIVFNKKDLDKDKNFDKMSDNYDTLKNQAFKDVMLKHLLKEEFLNLAFENMYEQHKDKKLKKISKNKFISQCEPKFVEGVEYGYSSSFDALIYPEINRNVKKIIEQKK